MSPDRIAQCAQLSMLLELSAGPKPGNVDRCHDHQGMGFRHFLASAVSVYPVLQKAACGELGLGMAILEAVREWRSFGLSGNTHFGEVTLLVPLVTAAGRGGVMEEELNSVLDASTTEDAISFYQAFQLSGARVAEVKEFSLKDPSASTRLQLQEKTLLELMRLSQGHDLIAKEWSTGFKRIFELSRMLSQKVEEGGWNDGVSLTFLEALSSEPDTLVQAKFDRFKAEEVSLRAAKVLQDKYPLNQAKKLDEALLEEGINPGSTADMIGAAIFIALMKGLRL